MGEVGARAWAEKGTVGRLRNLHIDVMPLQDWI